MNYLKYLLYALAAFILVLIGVGLFGPKTYHVERSINITTDAVTIYQQINNFKSLNTWSPWNKYDTTAKHTYEGVEGTVGSKTCWEGNDQVGSGCQIITKLEANKRVDIDLAFVKPFKSQAKTYFEITPGEGSQTVTWAIDGDNNFMSKIFGLFMSMDKMMGKDFEGGLADLKTICENAPKTYRGYEIKEMQVEAKNYIGVRKTMAFTDDFPAFFGASYGLLMMAKQEVIGAPAALYFNWDEANKKTDMAAVLPVKDAKAGKGYEVFSTPASKALVIDYYGAYDKSQEAHYAMEDYMKGKEFKWKAPVIEEYITDPMSEKDTAKWLTKIYYLVD